MTKIQQVNVEESYDTLKHPKEHWMFLNITVNIEMFSSRAHRDLSDLLALQLNCAVVTSSLDWVRILSAHKTPLLYFQLL